MLDLYSTLILSAVSCCCLLTVAAGVAHRLKVISAPPKVKVNLAGETPTKRTILKPMSYLLR